MAFPRYIRLRFRLNFSLGSVLCLLSLGCNSPTSTSSNSDAKQVTFAGVSSIDLIGGNQMRINWSPISDAQSYLVYNVTSGTPVLLANVAASSNTNYYLVTGLTPNTVYSFSVHVQTSSGLKDSNNNITSVATLRFGVTHQGWIRAMALGGRKPVSQATGLATTSASITLGWNTMTSSSSSVTAYNVYRSTTSGGEDFASPLVAGNTTKSFTDNSVSPLTTYYYIVRPVIGSTEYPTYSTDTEIKIPVPPVNMSLVHRWIANWEMCSNLMDRGYDRDNNYRCSYVGPGNNNGYYDIGQNQFWDTVHLGCNYTPPNVNSALSCGDSTNGCLNITNGSPNTTTYPPATYSGQVIYDRGASACYISSGTAWIGANNATNAQLAAMTSNQPGLPPLVTIDQTHSWNVCQQFSVSGYGSKRLPRHSEQVVAAAWPTTYSDVLISSIENGTNLNTTGYCNTNNGSGLTYDNNATPANLETIPATNTSHDRAVRTGSASTANCVSLHGIQDMAGNVWQWSSDQLANCTSSAPYTCSGEVSTLDPTNTDWFWESGSLPINFNGLIGPGGGSTTIGNWTFVSESNGSTDFLPALGIPLVKGVASGYDEMVIGTGTGQFNPAHFHGNEIALNTGNGKPARAGLGGGGWDGGALFGRFVLYLAFAPTDAYFEVGARCLVSAGN